MTLTKYSCVSELYDICYDYKYLLVLANSLKFDKVVISETWRNRGYWSVHEGKYYQKFVQYQSIEICMQHLKLIKELK